MLKPADLVAIYDTTLDTELARDASVYDAELAALQAVYSRGRSDATADRHADTTAVRMHVGEATDALVYVARHNHQLHPRSSHQMVARP